MNIKNEDDVLQGVRVLVVDDEEVLAWSIEAELKKHGVEVVRAGTAADAREQFAAFAPDVAVCDLRLPDGDGLDLLQEWRIKVPTLPVILITAHGAVETAVSAVRLSAFDYLQKPFNMKDLLAAVRRASEVSQLRQKVSRLEGALSGREPVKIIGNTLAIKGLRKKLERVAATNTDTVLVIGETGSGKELAARAIHEWSAAAHKPYIEINCASIPENLLESELFGYEKGAFTDARSRKLGLFEMASEGTIFLDEIGELPMKLQAKLLRALEYRRFRRLGGVTDITFNARIVAATNRRLIDEVRAGRFRADLYYRLNVVPIEVPPLRERKADLPTLAQFFLGKICQQLAIPVPEIADETIAMFKEHDWPGNVRELRNVLHRAIVLEGPSVLLPGHILLDAAAVNVDAPNRSGNGEAQSHHDAWETNSNGGASGAARHARGSAFELPPEGISLEELEKTLLTQALARAQYNQSKAADLLAISRHTLRYRMEKHGLLVK